MHFQTVIVPACVAQTLTPKIISTSEGQRIKYPRKRAICRATAQKIRGPKHVCSFIRFLVLAVLAQPFDLLFTSVLNFVEIPWLQNRVLLRLMGRLITELTCSCSSSLRSTLLPWRYLQKCEVLLHSRT
eukprot:TRINITY_DN60614_c0_g1_i1.p1 TRINITY_DN60614_c0_g1~~TRINITY_DN60614_c0_g1_i1.p1  ORF type:complete len:129 (-),score=3.30 TRINITY_DN60614_c0_g1_i1:186-572(-)